MKVDETPLVMNCVVCRSNQLEELLLPAKNVSVASDCRPLDYAATIMKCRSCGHYQKAITPTYLNNIDNIYASYQAYQLTQGKEQLNFSADVPQSRCQMILSNCDDYLTHLPYDSHILDVGTGSGVMLNAVQHADNLKEHSLKLFAQDVSDHQKNNLKQQYQIQGFYLSLEEVEQTFELITLIHVLEHVYQTEQFLSQLARLLSDDGCLIIQVPDITTNEWDFAIYDHISHFSPYTLLQLVKKYFAYAEIVEKQINKEITVVACHRALIERKDTGSSVENKENSGDEAIDKFKQNCLLLDEVAKNVENGVSVLGTGPSASFAGHYLGDKHLCWRDEDSSKVGQVFCHKAVKALNQAEANEVIVLPYPENQRARIFRQYPMLNFYPQPGRNK